MPRSRSSDTFKSRKELVPLNDAELFVMAFEKPTQIYRYLKTRSLASPLFLHRNLSYMRGRCIRNHKSRATFKIDSMLSSIQNKSQKPFEKLSNNENLIIAFIQFSDNQLTTKYVKVETKLEKISHKRRKEGTAGQNQIHIGESNVIVNSDENGTDKLPAVCVSSTEFDRLGENVQTTYQLTFDIESTPFPSNTTDGDEPPLKYSCFRKQYHAELEVFDKNGRNLLVNGIYDVTALDRHAFRPSRKLCWESFPSETDQHIANWAEEVNKYYFSEEDSNPFMTFDRTPKIQLYLEWTRMKITGNNYITRPKFITDQSNNNNKENTSSNNSVHLTNGKVNEVNGTSKELDVMPKTFTFQFIFNNSAKQRTEERFNFLCPWCSLDCMRIYSLMKHLKLCHARLLFQYIEDETKCRIDVYINDMYDGSYSGAPHDVLLGNQRQNGPTRRNVMTSIMVFKPRRPTYNMCEFQEADDAEMDQQRQYISGHNRIYYHSETCIPIMPKELDYDSEGDPDPKWLQRTTKQMIDEFTDVNEGEKELMKLWNLHVMKHGFVGDCQIALACDLFLKENGRELLKKNLYRNYIVHLGSMFNYGLISPKIINENIRKLNKLMHENEDDINASRAARQVQIVNWQEKESKQQVKDNSIATPSRMAQNAKDLLKNNRNESKLESVNAKVTARTPKNGDVQSANLGSPAGPLSKMKQSLKRKLSMA